MRWLFSVREAYKGRAEHLSLIHILSREVIRVLKEQYEQTLQILTRWQGALETLAGELIRRETLSGEEFMEIWTRVIDMV